MLRSDVSTSLQNDVPRERVDLVGTATRMLWSWEGGLVAIVALGLFLRVYGMALQGWTPDTYEQLEAGRRLAAGEFPISQIYPAGVAVTMAPFFAIFPATLMTMQVVIIGTSLVLIALGPIAVRRATGDGVAAHILALCFAAMPLFVYFSRDGLFDVVNTMWIVGAVLLVPELRRRGLSFAAWYGVGLAVACSVRITNIILPSAIVVYWLALERPRGIVDALQCLIDRRLISAGVALFATYGLLTCIGGWMAGTGDASVGVGQVPYNVVFNVAFEFGGPLAAIVLFPLAVIGATEVWRRSQALAIVSVYMLATWPLPYLVLPYANSRYMLPAFAFALIFVAHSPSAIRRLAHEGRFRTRHWQWVAYVVAAILAIGYLAADVQLLAGWHEQAGRSNEAAFRLLRPRIAELPADTVLVSTATRGVRDSNERIQYFDLIDYSIDRGSTREAVDAGVASIANDVRAGRPVYYLHTGLDADDDNLGRAGLSFGAYYEGLDAAFDMELVLDTSIKDIRLYRVEPGDSLFAPAR